MGAARTDDLGTAAGGGAAPAPAAVALIDGEHYPPVVRAALAALQARFTPVAALFLGGEEKLRSLDSDEAALAEMYGLPVRRTTVAEAVDGALAALLAETRATTVVDLSDEPVLGYRERFRLISVALAANARYVGADFEFLPQGLTRLSSKPSLAVIGTGKRVGKTAISGSIARTLKERYEAGGGIAILAMGRGGPPEPEVVRGGEELGVAELLAASRRGRHAASDCYEDALLAGVTAVGCRRCGGGMGGSAFDSNVAEALPLLEGLPVAFVILEGSGSVIPPVRAEGVVCVADASQPVDYIAGYLGTYRLLTSDLIVLTMCEPPFADASRVARLRGAVADVDASLPVVPTVFRPRPVEEIRGEKVAYFTTSAAEAVPVMAAHLEEEYGARVVSSSRDLASRSALAAALRDATAQADVFVTEIKAAAIDVVAEAAAAAGKRLVFCDNEPRSVDGSDLTSEVLALAERCEERFARSG